MKPNPSRGEIWLVDLNPTRGHEQAGVRPALIFSVDKFNHGPAGLVIVLPITTKDKGIRSHIRIEPSPTGVKKVSFVKCEEIRCISKERCEELLGTVDSVVLTEAGFNVSILLGL